MYCIFRFSMTNSRILHQYCMMVRTSFESKPFGIYSCVNKISKTKTNLFGPPPGIEPGSFRLISLIVAPENLLPQKWQRNSVLSMWLEGTTQNPSPTPAVTGKYGAVLVERIILAGQIRGQMSVCRA